MQARRRSVTLLIIAFILLIAGLIAGAVHYIKRRRAVAVSAKVRTGHDATR